MRDSDRVLYLIDQELQRAIDEAEQRLRSRRLQPSKNALGNDQFLELWPFEQLRHTIAELMKD